jgi:hypothetical protein
MGTLTDALAADLAATGGPSSIRTGVSATALNFSDPVGRACSFAAPFCLRYTTVHGRPPAAQISFCAAEVDATICAMQGAVAVELSDGEVIHADHVFAALPARCPYSLPRPSTPAHIHWVLP